MKKVYLISTIVIAVGLLMAMPSVANATLVVHDFSGADVSPNNLNKWTGSWNEGEGSYFVINSGAGELHWTADTLGWGTNLADDGDPDYDLSGYGSLSFDAKLSVTGSEAFKVFFHTSDGDSGTYDITVSSTDWITFTIPFSNFSSFNPTHTRAVNFGNFDTGGTILYDNIKMNPVPEPATMMFFGSLATGLFGIAGLRRRFSKR